MHALLKYDLEKHNFLMTTENTFLDLMTVLKVEQLSSFMMNDSKVSRKEMLSVFYLCRAHLLLININHKYM